MPVEIYSFRTVERCLRAVGHVQTDQEQTFHARILKMQRLGLPNGINVGRGIKKKYSLEHITQMLVALYLFSLTLPPRFVVGAVEDAWDPIVRYINNIAAQGPVRECDKQLDSLLIVEPILADISRSQGYMIRAIPHSDFLRDSSGSSSPCSIVLDLAELVDSIRKNL